MQRYTDQTGGSILLPVPAKRIVSLVPSQTELLYSLGLEQEVVGITKFCVHPSNWFREKTRVGGTKKIDIGAVRRLKPDLVLANKEENEKEQVDALKNDFRVWVSDIHTTGDACAMIRSLGEMTAKEKEAAAIADQIERELLPISAGQLLGRACYLVWQKPYMTVGGDTFIHAMMEAAGFENIFADRERYPELSMEELKTMDYDFLLLSSEPFPFREKHRQELMADGVKARVLLVDGEIFSWYGSRMLKAPAYFSELRREIEKPGSGAR